jgi:hypothetical protein
MSRLTEKWRPRKLSEIVGQPPVRILQRFAQAPYPRCFLLEGPGGVGKTTAALALANELNVHEFDLHVVIGSEFSIDKARDLWHGPLQNKPMNVGSWKLLLLEELEFLSGQTCTPQDGAGNENAAQYDRRSDQQFCREVARPVASKVRPLHLSRRFRPPASRAAAAGENLGSGDQRSASARRDASLGIPGRDVQPPQRPDGIAGPR